MYVLCTLAVLTLHGLFRRRIGGEHDGRSEGGDDAETRGAGGAVKAGRTGTGGAGGVRVKVGTEVKRSKTNVKICNVRKTDAKAKIRRYRGNRASLAFVCF